MYIINSKDFSKLIISDIMFIDWFVLFNKTEYTKYISSICFKGNNIPDDFGLEFDDYKRLGYGSYYGRTTSIQISNTEITIQSLIETYITFLV